MNSLCPINQSGFLKRPKIWNYRSLHRHTSEKASALRVTVFSISLKTSIFLMHVFKGQQIKYFLSQVLFSSELSHDQQRCTAPRKGIPPSSAGWRMDMKYMQQPWRIKHIFNKTNLVFHLIIHTCVWTHRGKFLEQWGVQTENIHCANFSGKRSRVQHTE